MRNNIAVGATRALALSAAVFVFAFGATCVSAQEAGLMGAGLTGNVRDSFVGTATQTCTAQQTNATENTSIPKTARTSYCGCYANGLADRLSTGNLLSLLGLSPSDRLAKMKPLIEAVVPVCVAEVTKQMQTAVK
jgi:hypothetical protein